MVDERCSILTAQALSTQHSVTMMMGLHPNLHLFTLSLALCGVYGLEVRQLQNGTATPNLTTKVFKTDHFFRVGLLSAAQAS
jgi:hypothetical protein